MFQLPCGVGLGVDIGDFLELERTLHGDRIVNATAQEQGVLALNESPRHALDRRVKQQGAFHAVGQPVQG